MLVRLQGILIIKFAALLKYQGFGNDNDNDHDPDTTTRTTTTTTRPIFTTTTTTTMAAMLDDDHDDDDTQDEKLHHRRRRRLLPTNAFPFHWLLVVAIPIGQLLKVCNAVPKNWALLIVGLSSPTEASVFRLQPPPPPVPRHSIYSLLLDAMSVQIEGDGSLILILPSSLST